MPTDVLDRVRAEIKGRLGELAEPVAEARRLEGALGALAKLAPDGRAASGNGRRRRRAATKAPKAKRPRRRRTPPGANDQTVLASLQGQPEPLDIKTVAEKTGLSQQTASYTLKKLVGAGQLRQSSRSGGRGLPKLVFSLASNAKGAATSTSSATKTKAPAASKAKRKARRKAGRRTQATGKAPGARAA